MFWCNNLSVISLAANPKFHARTKHIEVDVYFVRDKVVTKQLAIQYVPSSYQVVNILSKPLSTSRFLFLCDKLNLCSTPSILRGDDI